MIDTKVRKCFVDGDRCILRAKGKRFGTNNNVKYLYTSKYLNFQKKPTLFSRLACQNI